MALDVVPLNPGTGGANVSVDKINGTSVQVVKPAYGAEGSSTLVDPSHPLPVTDASAEASLDAIEAATVASAVTLGAPADAAASSDGGTWSLLALVKRLLGKLPATLGAKTSANSLAVVLASDQPAIGALPTMRAGSSTAATATTSASTAAAANADRRSLLVVNPRTNTATVWVSCWGNAATAPPSVPLEPGQRLVADGVSVPSGAVSVVAASGSQPVTIVEG